MAKGPGNRGVIVAAEVAERDAAKVREMLEIWALNDRVVVEQPRRTRTKAAAAEERADQEADEAAEGPAAMESDGAGG